MRFLLLLAGFLALPIFASAAIEATAEVTVEHSVTQPSRWMSSAEFDDYRISQNANMRFPETIEGRLHNGELQYRATFKGFLPGMNYYYAHWGLTDGYYEEALKKRATEGYRVHTHTVFQNDSGADIHQVTWIMTDEVPVEDWEAATIQIIVWLAIPVYLLLQFSMLRLYVGSWRVAVAIPAAGLIAVIAYSLAGFALFRNLPALPLLWFSPAALVWLLTVMVAHSLAPDQRDQTLREDKAL